MFMRLLLFWLVICLCWFVRILSFSDFRPGGLIFSLNRLCYVVLCVGCWVVLGCVGLCWVVLGCVGLCWVVLGCVGLCALGCVLGCVGLCCVLCVVLDCVLLGRLKEEIKTPPLVFHTRINATQLRWITMPRSPPPPLPRLQCWKTFCYSAGGHATRQHCNRGGGGEGRAKSSFRFSDSAKIQIITYQDFQKSRISEILPSRNPDFPEIYIFRNPDSQRSRFQEVLNLKYPEIPISRKPDVQKSWFQ